MIAIKNENVEFFDCDQTLVMHETDIPPGHSIQIFDSQTKQFCTLRINKNMVKLLKDCKHRGFHIVVWSRNGYEWASNVVKALDLTTHVDIVMTKPNTYYDDIPIDKWLKNRVYLEPSIIYKPNK